jgi:hypothetical protein
MVCGGTRSSIGANSIARARLGVAMPELLPVRISESASRSGGIHLEFGKVSIHVEGAVDYESLRIILEHVAR